MIPPRSPVRLSADWVLPIDAPPIRHGAVRVGPDGRIEAVGPAASFGDRGDEAVRHFSGAALMPGLVNAHTHLELTGLAGRVEHDDFSRWIRGVRELKAGLPPAWFAAAARRGVQDAFAAGITFVFDTGDSGAVFEALTSLGGAGVVYQEVFGPHPDQAAASLTELAGRVERARAIAGPRVTVGVSPHAVYTVSGALYRAVAALARSEGFPVAVHLAESLAETAFVTRGEGPFAQAWRDRGIPPLTLQEPDTAARRSPVAWLDAHSVIGPDTLAIHAVQVDASDVAVLRARGAAVAHCPISNRRHGHGDAPLAALLDAGVRLGVGTDSVISVGRLDLFAELRAARRLANLTAAQALALGTAGGAALAGPKPNFGTLAPGLWADVIAVALAEPGDAEPEEQVLAAGPEQILATYASGREVYRSDRLA